LGFDTPFNSKNIERKTVGPDGMCWRWLWFCILMLRLVKDEENKINLTKTIFPANLSYLCGVYINGFPGKDDKASSGWVHPVMLELTFSFCKNRD
jgi:hypothetical protein